MSDIEVDGMDCCALQPPVTELPIGLPEIVDEDGPPDDDIVGHRKGRSTMDAKPTNFVYNKVADRNGHVPDISRQRKHLNFVITAQHTNLASQNMMTNGVVQASDAMECEVQELAQNVDVRSTFIGHPQTETMTTESVIARNAGTGQTDSMHAISATSKIKAEVDPNFYGRHGPLCVTPVEQYDNVPMEEDIGRGAHNMGMKSARYVESRLLRNNLGPGIKGAQSESVQARPPIVHKMSLKQFMSHEYDMSHAKRGKAIVVNNVVFKDSDDHQAREGSFRDAIKLREILEELRFETIRRRDHEGQLVYADLSVEKLRELLADAVNPDLNDYTDCDCFIFVVMSYGIDGAVLCSGPLIDEFIEITEIVDNFKPDSCPSLLMKPKIFLLQLDPAFTIEIADAATVHDDGILKPNVQKVPKEADILIQCSYMSGFYGWLDDDDTGLSWYIRAVTEGLRRFVLAPMRTHKKSMDFMSVMNRINMIFVKIMGDEGLTPDRQIGGPQIMSTFTKQMTFTVKPTDTLG